MSTLSSVSVIIPTYNRKSLLREALDSLARQTYSADRFEVIIVDDGSTDGTDRIAEETFPFALRYFWQSNQGDAEARNLGARQSQADFLVFIDDDILVDPGYVTHLIEAQGECQNRIVVGSCHLWLEESSPFAQIQGRSLASNQTGVITEVLFRDVCSNNMSVRREAYFEIGMMQGLDFPGSSMWCDLDFAYRAVRQGFEFRCSTGAVCWHRDYTARSLDAQKKRAKTAAYRAVVLFQKYPELLAQVPMFRDKTAISWGQDPPRLIARKLARAAASCRPILWSIEQTVRALEKRYPVSTLPAWLCRYIVGAHLFQGFREGLNEFGPITTGIDSVVPLTG